MTREEVLKERHDFSGEYVDALAKAEAIRQSLTGFGDVDDATAIEDAHLLLRGIALHIEELLEVPCRTDQLGNLMAHILRAEKPAEANGEVEL